MNSKPGLMSLFILIVSLLSFSYQAQAVTALKGGTLQAYWKAEWNDEATINTPQLGFRYFPNESALEKVKVIDIFMDGSDENKIIFIKSNFNNIPDNFLQYKEWYVNQKGDLTVKEIRHYVECNADHYAADFVSFTPAAKSDATTDDDTGCAYGGSFPYLTSYILKEHTAIGQLKDEPRENANVEYTFSRNDSVVKIRTVNQEWMYVSVYDPSAQDRLSDKRGYIRFSDVAPLN
ncbi:hypothetical protein [Mixta calida]|uniref:hypothetical protein n=1 Tax=Mixta calida TaxID=665913 RepID=UPI00292CD117|nr:hypothetical protein [Mixta calida]